MGCGLISQRGLQVEVRHEQGNGVASRSNPNVAGETGRARGSPSGASAVENQRISTDQGELAASPRHHASRGVSSNAEEAAQRGRGSRYRRSVVAGERVALASRLPGNIQDYAFCFECGAFFQLGTQRAPQCGRCGSGFVQYLRGAGQENWVSAESTTGVNFIFDDQLDNSITASLEETPIARKPTKAAVLQALPTVQLSDAEAHVRAKLEEADPKRHCAICKDVFTHGDSLKVLPCSHEFHCACVVTWLQGNNTCPICRWKLPEACEGEADDEEADVARRAKHPVPQEA